MASSNLQIEEEEQPFTRSQVYNLHKLLEIGCFKQTKGKYKTQVGGNGGGGWHLIGILSPVKWLSKKGIILSIV